MQFTLKSVQFAQKKLLQLSHLRCNQIVSHARFSGGWRFGAKLEREALDNDEKLATLHRAIVAAELVERLLLGDNEQWTVPHDEVLVAVCQQFGIKL